MYNEFSQDAILHIDFFLKIGYNKYATPKREFFSFQNSTIKYHFTVQLGSNISNRFYNTVRFYCG